MAADSNAPLGGQGIHLKQGSTELVIGSTSRLTFESGAVIGGAPSYSTGTVSISSGVPLAVAGSTGNIVINTGGRIAMPVTSIASSSGTLSDYGIAQVGSTSANTYLLAHPSLPGLQKWIFWTIGGASAINTTLTTLTTASYIRDSTAATGDTHTITWTEAGGYVGLISLTTAEWRIIANSGGALT